MLAFELSAVPASAVSCESVSESTAIGAAGKSGVRHGASVKRHADRTAISEAGHEAMSIAGIHTDRCAPHQQGRVESPAKRAEENSIRRDERVRAIPRIPIPTASVPRRQAVVGSAWSVGLRLANVGFGHEAGAPLAPLIQIVLRKSVAIELLRLELARTVEEHFVSLSNVNLASAL